MLLPLLVYGNLLYAFVLVKEGNGKLKRVIESNVKI